MDNKEEMEIPQFPPEAGDVLSGRNGRYSIKKRLGEGGKGTAYLAQVLTPENQSEQQVVIKLPNLSLERSDLEINERLHQVRDDIDNEFNAWYRLRRVEEAKGLIAEVLDTGIHPAQIRGSVKQIPFIVQEFIDGLQLKHWCILHWGVKERGKEKKFKGIPDIAAWLKAIKLLTLLIKTIHDQRVIHGDVWPPNLMVRNMDKDDYGIVLIDFGQAWFLDHNFHQKGGDNYRYAYYAPERWTREGRTWYAPAEMYSLGGIFYYLATGEDPPNPYKGNEDPESFKGQGEASIRPRLKSNTELKNEISTKIRKKNVSLYTDNPGVVDIIHYCLRAWPDERAPHSEALFQVIEAFSNPFSEQCGPSSEELTLDGVMQQTARLSNASIALQSIDNQLFYKLVLRNIRSLHAQVLSARTRLYNIAGDRDQIINDLLSCVSCLCHGDQCIALTTSLFWRKQNFGANGRFLTMLKMAALHGISVKWVTISTVPRG